MQRSSLHAIAAPGKQRAAGVTGLNRKDGRMPLRVRSDPSLKTADVNTCIRGKTRSFSAFTIQTRFETAAGVARQTRLQLRKLRPGLG
jgi:hypothetical protein